MNAKNVFFALSMLVVSASAFAADKGKTPVNPTPSAVATSAGAVDTKSATVATPATTQAGIVTRAYDATKTGATKGFEATKASANAVYDFFWRSQTLANATCKLLVAGYVVKTAYDFVTEDNA